MYKTMEEIRNEHDGYWVYLKNCAVNEHQSIEGGEVAFICKTQAEIFNKMKDFRGEPSITFFFYAGKTPDTIGMMI
ncbi:MAG: hypothetical protein FWB74_00430 [Defluviitaleaceae bacterium]|nr:hypothetical protein [Defluviitaleaceae bacterium]